MPLVGTQVELMSCGAYLVGPDGKDDVPHGGVLGQASVINGNSKGRGVGPQLALIDVMESWRWTCNRGAEMRVARSCLKLPLG